MSRHHNYRRFPSARVNGLRSRLNKERKETIPAKKAALQATIDAVRIIANKDHEGDTPTLQQVLAGEIKARLMLGGKFVSKAAVQEQITAHVNDILSKLKGLGAR